MLKKTKLINAIQLCLIILLVILVMQMISSINRIQGNSRVVNYSGIVRGSIQRLIKLEISREQNDDLIHYIDSILVNLRTGSGDYHLERITDQAYLQNLGQLSTAWEQLKQEIHKFRLIDTKQSELLKLSEDIFRLSNDTVSSVETYAEKQAGHLKLLEFALVFIVALILFLIVMQVVSVLLTNRKNKALNAIAYIDAHTGLSNRSRCEHVIHENKHYPGKQYACIMYDLNNLKQTNDQYGHIVGDELIYNFAGILLSISSESVFVGRYGGDEFIVILSETSEDEVKSIIQNIQVKLDYYNSNKSAISISCAFGYELAVAEVNFSLQTLLIKADEKMYKNKALMKSIT